MDVIGTDKVGPRVAQFQTAAGVVSFERVRPCDVCGKDVYKPVGVLRDRDELVGDRLAVFDGKHVYCQSCKPE